MHQQTSSAPKTLSAIAARPDMILRYTGRRDELLAMLRSFDTDPAPYDHSFIAIVEMLHKVAGIAALFGAAEFGQQAARYHAMLKSAPAALRTELVSEALATLTNIGMED